jgi:phosphate acyltransferase
VSEGLVDLMKHLLREALESTISGRIGALLAKEAFTNFKKRVDYSEYGGAPLLGVRGVCIIGHGSSSVKAIKNAIRMAKEFSEGNVNKRIEEELRLSAFEKTVVKAE